MREPLADIRDATVHALAAGEDPAAFALEATVPILLACAEAIARAKNQAADEAAIFREVKGLVGALVITTGTTNWPPGAAH